MSENELLQKLQDAVIQGNQTNAVALAKESVEAGIDPAHAYEQGLRLGITVVGEKFASGEFYLPDLVIAADTMKAAGEILEAEIERTGGHRELIGKVVLGTVEGDLHDIGKTIVGTMLSTNGFEVIDLGVNVSKDAFIEAVKEHQPNMVGMSSLLTITAKQLDEVISALKEGGLRDSVKVIVGGGAVTDEYTAEIGADGYGQDAEVGVRIAKQLLNIA
jgi:corrinoid protein of di/trimethylamine methyltransferase